MTFDDVLPTLLRACETWEHAAELRQVAVVRDLRGLVRLAIESTEDGAAHVDALPVRLAQELGQWFTGEVLSTRNGKLPLRNVARRVLDVAPAWPDPRFPDPIGGQVAATAGRWKLWERRVGKQPWLEGDGGEPWVLDDASPAVATFYSFKGGVGRTTTLAACALFAAQAKEDVVVVDLDLEAPGLASVFGAEVERGVVDVLVDHLATGVVDLGTALARPRALPEDLARHRGARRDRPARRAQADPASRRTHGDARADPDGPSPGAEGRRPARHARPLRRALRRAPRRGAAWG